MLQARNPDQQGRVEGGYHVEIVSIATAVPKYRVTQEQALERACDILPQYSSLTNVFNMTGIDARYSSVPVEWYKQPRGWKASNAVYVENALDLLTDVAGEAIAEAGLTPGNIDAVVSVSTTGLAIPSLDALLSNRIGLNPNAERTPVFGLGCAGGTSGLARAARIAHSMPGGNVLFVVVELAGLNVHLSGNNPALFVSSALFGDGAAGLVLRNTNGGVGDGWQGVCRIYASGEQMWRDTTGIMGWVVEDDGLDVVLSPVLPNFTRDNLKPAVEAFLASQGMTRDDLDGFVFHPGGPKVLETIEDVLDLDRTALQHSWDVLRDYGNMSAPTVLFILQQTIKAGARGRHLMVSFGPAFTVSFAILDL